MNLPDIHTQKLLDCLTHSRLGFALYRLPWTDECYLVLQTSGDVEQLADIQELNEKKGFVMAPSGYRRNIPWYLSVRMSRHTTGMKSAKHCLHWNVRMPCSPAKAGRVNSPLLFPKKRIKNNIPAHSGVSSLPYKRSSFRNWFCHVLPPDISEMIFHHLALLSGPVTIIRA